MILPEALDNRFLPKRGASLENRLARAMLREVEISRNKPRNLHENVRGCEKAISPEMGEEGKVWGEMPLAKGPTSLARLYIRGN